MTVAVLQGDMRDLLAAMPDASFDCIVTDPPYGETSLAWDRWPDGWPALVRRVLKPTGSMWVFGSLRMFLDRRDDFAGWALVQEIVWEKHNGTNMQNDRFRRVHELAVQFRRDDTKWADVYRSPQFTLDATPKAVRWKARPAQWGKIDAGFYRSEDGGPRLMRSVLQVRSMHGRAVHPTQKPVEIVAPLVRYACPPGGAVLDPFCGSGTTGIVAREIGAHATLIELNPEYAAIAKRRISEDEAPLFASVDRVQHEEVGA